MRKSRKMRTSGGSDNEATGGGSGLTTGQAFDRLFVELNAKLENYRDESKKNWKEVLQSSFSTRSRHSTLTWSSLLVLFIESFIIFVLYVFNYSNIWSKLLPEAMVMVLIGLTNVAILVWDNYKRLNELPRKLSMICNYLSDEYQNYDWNVCNYPELHMPISPCITMQIAFRDGKMVNLPWALLVAGDVIVLQPAQKIIADCRLLSDPAHQLSAGQIFSPLSSSPMENCAQNSPRLHAPLSKNLAIVTATPYMQMIDLSFTDFLSRPPTFYNKERHIIVTRIIELIILPLGLMSFVALCLVRMFYLPYWLGIRVAPWADIILLQPMANTFPLLPVSLPFIWTLMQCVGNAKLFEGIEIWGYNKNKGQGTKPDVDSEQEKETVIKSKNFLNQCQEVIDFFLGKEETLHRSQKLLHVLASLTALCCVDKKGILSWPNPVADKIFFLKSSPSGANNNNNNNNNTSNNEVSSDAGKPSFQPVTTAEVLDITNDNNNELHFDDTSWEEYLPNLKPLGLNILLNTCNEQTRSVYSSFHSHISHELYDTKRCSSDHDLVVPVTSRRCLCEVAKIIGFTENAIEAFKLEQELCSFRHIESDQLSRDKLTKAKIKFPFPHMMGVVVSEKPSLGLQLMTQGTGDLILDACEDFWDGKDLKPLTDYERKLILDFYQRTSLSSICTAFSYKPLATKASENISADYLELPPSKGLKFLPYYALANINDMERDKLHHGLTIADMRDTSISTDCLLSTDTNKEEEVGDLRGCIQLQSRQIFIGMVTMQYQACMDMVQLIEQLDQACIRFVHFSKENELRSRVFSEKMGLESGWNCHITLSGGDNEDSVEGETECTTTDPVTSMYLGSDLNRHRPSVAKSLHSIKKFHMKTDFKSGAMLIPESNCVLPRYSASVPEIVMLSRSVDTGGCASVLNNTFQQKAKEAPTTLDEDDEGRDVEEDSQITVLVPLIDTKNQRASAGFQFSSDEEDTHSRVRFEEGSKHDNDTNNDGSNTISNEGVSPSVLDSVCSTVRSPAEGSFQEAYDLVEHPTPLGFDMSNRAKLPRGIKQVKPHLENVDNVPLLVSLFTDCTAENAGEMIRIMQDYGEVTLLMGSVCNIENKSLFLQADASIALEPMYPQSCLSAQPFLPVKTGIPPTEVAMLLTSLSCSLSFKRRESVSFHNLIARARHFMNNCVRNSIQLWICLNIAVTFLGLVALLLLLPPLFSLSDSMWLTCVVIPCITLGTAFAIMGKVDLNVMDAASWKNQCQIDRQMFAFAFWFYGMKFIPSVLNLCFMAVFNLTWICSSIPNSTCSWVYPIHPQHHQPPVSGDSSKPIPLDQTSRCISTWSCDNAEKLLVVQQFTVLFLTFYFVTISASFVYRFKYLWVQNPFFNKIWVCTSLVVLVLQLLYCTIKLSNTKQSSHNLLPSFSYIWAVCWAPVALGVNELIRRHEIKINIRHQKRARLDFGTKLGMNSPF